MNWSRSTSIDWVVIACFVRIGFRLLFLYSLFFFRLLGTEILSAANSPEIQLELPWIIHLKSSSMSIRYNLL